MTDVHALSGAYAVDALDDLERAQFERHLSDCADCQAEVASLRGAATLLADTVVTAPPASLRSSVLAGIQNVRPLPPPVGQRDETVADREPDEHDELAQRRRSPWLRGLVAAAAAVAVIGTGSAIVQPWGDNDTIAVTDVERVLRASDKERIVQEFADGSKATVVVSRKVGRSVILTENMADAPAGKDYQLWYQKGGRMVSAGLMPDDEPDATVLLKGDATNARAVGITVEPEGGSPEPTSDPVALFSIPT